ncbi:adenylate/guanylate cyclase domain-containing protein [Leptolyngbya subtilissima ST-M1]
MSEQIRVLETTYNCLKATYNRDLRGEVWVKGKGQMRTSFCAKKDWRPPLGHSEHWSTKQ